MIGVRICITAAVLLIYGCDGVRTPVQPSVEPLSSVPPQPVSPASVSVAPGEYALTFRADPQCNLPDFARQRTFTAQVFQEPWDPFLSGQITGATIRSAEYYDFWLEYEYGGSQGFFIGNYVENFGIMEEIDQGLVLLFGKALLVPSNSTMSGHIDGKIGYCPGPVKAGSTPSEACRNPPVICQSDKHQIDLERR